MVAVLLEKISASKLGTLTTLCNFNPFLSESNIEK